MPSEMERRQRTEKVHSAQRRWERGWVWLCVASFSLDKGHVMVLGSDILGEVAEALSVGRSPVLAYFQGADGFVKRQVWA